jgi:parallel beta-helix repeat protein
MKMRRKVTKMKSNAKSKTIIFIALGILFALLPLITANLSFITGNSNKSSDYSDDSNLNNENLKISAVSEKIHINGNSEWFAFKNDGNCSGEGTYSDPYLIEDLVIDGGGSGSCILIGNSTVYFRIENCTVYKSGPSYPNAGIKLSNVTNAQLIDNDCSSNYDGIVLDYCTNNSILGNTANNNDEIGIFLRSSDRNNISGNTANYNLRGIYLGFSKNNTISGNTANNNNFYDGIKLNYSNNNTISGKTANNNYLCGITLSYSDNNTISGNTANNNNLDGIYLHSSFSNTISGNILIGNSNCYTEFLCEGNIFENNYCENRIDLTILNLIILLTILFIA